MHSYQSNDNSHTKEQEEKELNELLDVIRGADIAMPFDIGGHGTINDLEQFLKSHIGILKGVASNHVKSSYWNKLKIVKDKVLEKQ